MIEFELDGKASKTSYKILESFINEDGQDCSRLLVELHTGRLHQIRRHLNMLDHPVLGDPKYGKLNKNSSGMKLKAVRLEFKDPFSGEWIEAHLNDKNELSKTKVTK